MRSPDENMVNQYGVPFHACNGYRHDEHYWSRLTHLRLTQTSASTKGLSTT